MGVIVRALMGEDKITPALYSLNECIHFFYPRAMGRMLRDKTPKGKSGRLRFSWKSRRQDIGTTIVFNPVPYGKFLALGTGFWGEKGTGWQGPMGHYWKANEYGGRVNMSGLTRGINPRKIAELVGIDLLREANQRARISALKLARHPSNLKYVRFADAQLLKDDFYKVVSYDWVRDMHEAVKKASEVAAYELQWAGWNCMEVWGKPITYERTPETVYQELVEMKEPFTMMFERARLYMSEAERRYGDDFELRRLRRGK